MRGRPPADVRVLVVGATGYIGKYVVKELVKRGYQVVAFARERSGIGGKASADDTRKVRSQALARNLDGCQGARRLLLPLIPHASSTPSAAVWATCRRTSTCVVVTGVAVLRTELGLPGAKRRFHACL